MYMGIDVGNGYVKVVNGNGKIFKFSSYVTKGKELDLDLELKETTSLNNLKVWVNDKYYFVGELARKHKGTRELINEKSRREYILPLALTGIALASEKETLCPNLVIGLPINDYKNQAYNLEKKIIGDHNVIVGNKHLQIEINDNHIKAFPEGAGVVYDLLLNNSGDIIRQDLAAKKIGIIDVGWKTVNFLVLNKMEFDDEASGTIQEGMSQAFRPYFKRMSGQYKYSMAEFEAMMDQYAQEEMKDLAKVIQDQLSIFWTETKGMDIYLAGGGGKAISPYFELPHKLIEGCQEANARGFMKVAKMLWPR